MKIACIALNSNLIEIKEQTNIIDFINKKLYEIGENISLISYFDNSLEKLKQINPYEITPIEALNILYELKKDVDNNK